MYSRPIMTEQKLFFIFSFCCTCALPNKNFISFNPPPPPHCLQTGIKALYCGGSFFPQRNQLPSKNRGNLFYGCLEYQFPLLTSFYFRCANEKIIQKRSSCSENGYFLQEHFSLSRKGHFWHGKGVSFLKKKFMAFMPVAFLFIFKRGHTTSYAHLGRGTSFSNTEP